MKIVWKKKKPGILIHSFIHSFIGEVELQNNYEMQLK